MLSIVTYKYLQKKRGGGEIKETILNNFTEKARLMRFLVIFIHI